MTIKTIFGALILAVLLSMAWHYRQAEFIQQWVHHGDQAKPVDISFDNAPPPSAGPPPQSAERQPTAVKVVGGMRKCKKGAQVIYTDGDCPVGSKELDIHGGSVTVVPGQSPVSKLADSAQSASRPNVRDLLVDPKGANLQEKRIEQIINR